MFTKILKFIGLSVLLLILPIIPLGEFISFGIVGMALWKLID